MALMLLLVTGGCATLPDNVGREASTAYVDTHDTSIGRHVQADMAEHPGESGYLLLGNGLDAFVARVLLAQRAERSIDTQYYMIHDDVVGSLFVDQLYKAAERGVRVRLLLDDIDQYWNSELSYPISTLAEKPPTPEETTQRKKIFDDFIAGQVDSEYLQHLRDSDLANRIRQDRVTYHWGVGAVVADDPQKLTHDTAETKFHLSEQLAPYMADIRQELIIFSPYFVPGKSGVAFFKQLRDRGVQVKILTNSLASTDVGIVHAGYARYRHALLRMGVELYELNRNLSREERKAIKKGVIGQSKSSLHAKCFLLDRETAFIGSLNLDPRSVVQNTEIGVVLKSTAIAGHIADGFDRQIEQVAFRLELKKSPNGTERLVWHGIVDGEELTFDHDPYTGFWKQLGVGFMRLLPIESQI